MSLPLSSFALDGAFIYALRGFLALLFARAAFGKLSSFAEFATAIRGYELVPRAAAPLVGALLVGSELGLSVLLLVPRFGAVASLASGALLGLYACAIAINLARGRRDIDCGCSGPSSRQTLHELLLGRNAFYIALALLAASVPSVRALVWLDSISIALAIVALALLSISFDGLAALAARRHLGGFRS